MIYTRSNITILLKDGLVTLRKHNESNTYDEVHFFVPKTIAKRIETFLDKTK